MLAVTRVVAQLERELGIPVVDSVVAGAWGALRRAGVDTRPLAEHGRIFQLPAALPRRVSLGALLNIVFGILSPSQRFAWAQWANTASARHSRFSAELRHPP